MSRIESLSFAPSPSMVEAKPKLRLEDIPLASLLPPPEMRQTSSYLIMTAHHESHHALLAIILGADIEEVNVIPNGNVLGTTKIKGSVSDEKFKIIAAGGAVNPVVGGFASGYGLDLWQVKRLDRDFITGRSGGSSVDYSIFQAESMLNLNFTADVRIRIAEMVAYLGVVSGPILKEIIKRAKLESDLASQNRLGELSQVISGFAIQHEEKDHHKIEYSKEQLANPVYELVIVSEEGKEEKHLICAVCGGLDGAHHPYCQISHKTIADFSKRYKESEDRLPDGQVIFSRN